MMSLLYLSVGASLAARAASPVRIVGQIVEKGTDNAVPYASIAIKGTDELITADEEGRFEWTTHQKGRLVVRIQAMGYVAKEQTFMVSPNGMQPLRIALEREQYDMEEVVVSASRNEVKRSEAPVIVNVLNAKLFETVNSTDLAKSLPYQSGVRVENNCQNCGLPQVRINGLEGPYSQILINSRPVVSALSGVYGLEQIPVNMIERVEVVRGGGSALFGANAVGGTINVITRDPVSNSFQATSTMNCMEGGTWEQYMGANASLVSSDNTYGLALYESYRNRNAYDRNNDGFSELGKLNMHSFGLRGYYRPVSFRRLGIEFHSTDEQRRGGNKMKLQPHETDITEQTHHVINSGGINYDFYWKEYRHKMSFYASIQHIDRSSYYGAQQDPNAYGKTRDLTWVAGALYTGQLEKVFFAPSTLTAGLEYQDNSLHDVMTGYQRDMHQQVKIAGGFLQNEWKWDSFSLMAGGRLDKHNLIDYPIFSPRLNLLYRPNSNLQSRITWSTGFRAPQAYDEDLHVTAVGGEGVLIKLADGLKPEKSNSFSGSIDLSGKMGHFRSNLLIEAFYTRLGGVFHLTDIGYDEQGNRVMQRQNGDAAEVYGINLDGKIAHGNNYSLQVGVTYQRSRYTVPTVWSDNPQVEKIRKMPRTPDLYGYFTLNWKPAAPWDISFSGVYTGSMNVPHIAPTDVPVGYEYQYIAQDEMVHTPDFMELNMKAGYTFSCKGKLQLQLNGGIQNLFNVFQKDLDKGTYRDSGFFYGPVQPRTFYVGLKILGK